MISGACFRDSTSMFTRFQKDVAASSGERYSDSRSMLLKKHVAASSGHVAAIDGGCCIVLRSMLQ